VFTDTHCHLDLRKFDPDRAEVLRRAGQAGVTRILIPGLNLESSRAVMALAASHPMLYAAAGVHPTEAQTWTGETREELRKLTGPFLKGKGDKGEGKVVALGEIGLDYYWDSAPHEMQKTVLQEQLSLASELELPVVLHLREAKDAHGEPCADDLLEILGRWVSGLGGSPLKERPGVLHSFSGSLETAQAAIGLGFYIGVTGPVTFENAPERQALVAALPLEHLLIETDSPFLAPHPRRGRRNEPAYVCLIADKIALLHSCPTEQVAAVTTENAGNLFGWNGNST
jgi:TatD DNase family protein